MPITALYAALLALLFLALSLNVILHRWRSGVPLGTGKDKRLQGAMRAHGNFAEYVPLALLLVAGAESFEVSAWVSHSLGASLLVGRIAHAAGLLSARGPSLGRSLGVMLTFTAMAAGAGICLAAFAGFVP